MGLESKLQSIKEIKQEFHIGTKAALSYLRDKEQYVNIAHDVNRKYQLDNPITANELAVYQFLTRTYADHARSITKHVFDALTREGVYSEMAKISLEAHLPPELVYKTLNDPRLGPIVDAINENLLSDTYDMIIFPKYEFYKRDADEDLKDMEINMIRVETDLERIAHDAASLKQIYHPNQMFDRFTDNLFEISDPIYPTVYALEMFEGNSTRVNDEMLECVFKLPQSINALIMCDIAINREFEGLLEETRTSNEAERVGKFKFVDNLYDRMKKEQTLNNYELQRKLLFQGVFIERSKESYELRYKELIEKSEEKMERFSHMGMKALQVFEDHIAEAKFRIYILREHEDWLDKFIEN
jgi:hypothetical protein